MGFLFYTVTEVVHKKQVLASAQAMSLFQTKVFDGGFKVGTTSTSW